MNDTQWSALKDFVKKRFPACKKCQKGHHEGSDMMLVHLTASHFAQEAIETFGRGLFCSLCGERLPQHEESHKEYFVLNHMSKHFYFVAPEEIKDLLKVEPVSGAQANCDNECPVNAVDASRTISVTENLFDTLEGSQTNGERSKDERIDTEEVDTGIHPEESTLNSTQNHRSQKVSFQVCQEYFRNKYPTCKTCQRGHEWITNMKRHLVMQHCGEEAIKLFGSGNTCSVCRKYSIDTCHYKHRPTAIKSHMKAHLDQIYPDERGKSLLKLATKGRTYKLGSMWEDCLEYFKDKYPSCDVCNIGHSNSQKLKKHLSIMHYSKSALKHFGKGTKCQICNNFSIKRNNSSPAIQIKRHMACHLQDLIDDEKARTHLNNVRVHRKEKKFLQASTKLPEQNQ